MVYEAAEANEANEHGYFWYAGAYWDGLVWIVFFSLREIGFLVTGFIMGGLLGLPPE